jgi:hypothetical protein
MAATFLQKPILSRAITKFLLQSQTSQKTAIITPFGLFEYLFMPFGLSNAGQTYKHMMDCMPDGLEGVFANMDDSHMGSLDRQTHLLHLEAFNALASNGLAINFEKCVFKGLSLEILVTRFQQQDRPPQPVTLPKSGHQATASFLGMVNFYTIFLPNCAQVFNPSTDFLRGGGQNFGVNRSGTGGKRESAGDYISKNEKSANYCSQYRHERYGMYSI